MITHTVSELAEICGATLVGDGDRRVVGPASLREATEEEVSFLGNLRYLSQLEETRAAAVVVGPDVESKRLDLTLLRSEHPNRAFSRIVEAFRPAEEPLPEGVHPTAVLDPEVRLEGDVRIGPCAVVGRNAKLEDGVQLHAHVLVGAECTVGAGTVLQAGVVLYPRTRVGRNCLLHAGTVVGSDGFGFDPVADGWEKVPQCGTVLVEDDVEIGANCTIDRGRFGATRILRGSKLDNQVHVAHNASIGPAALLIAQVGVAGSTRIGERAIMAGQAGVSGHLEVGDGARVGGGAQVTKSLPGGKDYFGYPAIDFREQVRALVEFKRLPGLAKRVRELEKRIAELEQGGERPEES
jgi:UDP-3-O-[3-hydroxymyristoyl] glucosamine N-acyltransferase